MYNVASTTGDLGLFYNNTGTLLTYIIPVILLGLIALLGLGFGVRHLRKYISGRKF